MFNRILNKISGNYNTQQIKKIEPILERINHFYESYHTLSDEELQNHTHQFKQRYQQGESLDDLLPEAFATVKQACKRLVGKEFEVKGEQVTWNMIPYDVQLIGGVILHRANIAEMKTGEGKTLVATLPSYLNALTGKGVHIVTVNDYLASRDAAWNTPLFEFLGMKVGVVVKGAALQQRKAQYEADVTYVENSELGFDYLRDNLAKSINKRVLTRRPLHFAIVDEIDSILIDEARTPLIISEPDSAATNKYEYYAKIVQTLTPSKHKKKVSKGFLHELLNDIKKEQKQEEKDDGDYYIDKKSKSASLSSKGIQKVEKLLGVDNLYKDLGYQEIHHIENALKAQACYQQDKDYILSNNQVLIVDQNTGRAMQGRRFGQGLHQAIEAKHKLPIQKESKTLATVTYQNFFKNYEKLAGMTGTATTEGEEFDTIYDLQVLVVPTNRPVIRADMEDRVYFNQQAKRNAIVNHVEFAHRIGQPVLIGTSSIHSSELMSKILKKKRLTHSVLNAKMHEKEAHIVANAGKRKSIMVATNMAGRGTDIKLDKNLNSTLAHNYAQWIDNTLQGKSVEADGPTGVSATVYSRIECDWTREAIADMYGLTDEHINAAAKDRIHIPDTNYRIKIRYNKRKKNTDDAFAQIYLSHNNADKESLIEKDFHYGLCIIGTEKHESRRIDNQLRGRAGRQGDPGMSVFYVALDDLLMQKMGGAKIQGVASLLLSKEQRETIELTQKQFTNAIIRAQKQMEGWHFSIRKHLFDYDSVINTQRIRIYELRDTILHELQRIQTNQQQNQQQNQQENKQKNKQENEQKDMQDNTQPKTTTKNTTNIDPSKSIIIQEIRSFIDEVVSQFIATHIQLRTPVQDLENILDKEFNLQIGDQTDTFFAQDNYENLHTHLTTYINEKIDTILEEYDPVIVNTVLANIYLHIIDRNWIEHIDGMQHLRDKVGLASYAKQDPLVLYKKEAFEKFQRLLHNIKLGTLVTIMNTNFQQPKSTSRKQSQDNMVLTKLQQASASLPTKAQKNKRDQGAQAAKEIIQKKTEKQDLGNGVEIFEVDQASTKQPNNIEQSKAKIRPNDKINIQYTDGKVVYQVKYKKVKKDIKKGEARII